MNKKPFVNFLKDLPMWLHLAVILGVIMCLSMETMEGLIVLILMYDIGFEIRAIDKLIEINNSFRRWVYKKFHPKKRTKNG